MGQVWAEKSKGHDIVGRKPIGTAYSFSFYQKCSSNGSVLSARQVLLLPALPGDTEYPLHCLRGGSMLDAIVHQAYLCLFHLFCLASFDE